MSGKHAKGQRNRKVTGFAFLEKKEQNYRLLKWQPVEEIMIAVHLLREGNGTPLQYSCLENPMDEGAWQAVVHGVANSRR